MKPPLAVPAQGRLNVIADLKVAAASGMAIYRRQVAAAAVGVQPLPLIQGTEVFGPEWVASWHRQHHSWAPTDVACYSILDTVVSGAGQIWLGDQLVTSHEIMPDYVRSGLELANGGSDCFWAATRLPIRRINVPCLVAIGHGIHVYGHFLIELLFRILVAKQAFKGSRLTYHILLDRAAPDWLMKIITEDLDIDSSRLEYFEPDREQVLLRHAIVPTRPLGQESFHPFANNLIDELVDKLPIPRGHWPKRLFIARGRFQNAFAPNRICLNEQVLIDSAAKRHGFVPITIEDMSWREQIALFRNADVVVGQAGSGLHNGLFSKPGSRMGSIGFMNLVQSEIGALRRQNNAFLMNNIRLSGEFVVDKRAFDMFLDRVCE
jgi:capsular polysaccharide biosynthesis protein